MKISWLGTPPIVGVSPVGDRGIGKQQNNRKNSQNPEPKEEKQQPIGQSGLSNIEQNIYMILSAEGLKIPVDATTAIRVYQENMENK